MSKLIHPPTLYIPLFWIIKGTECSNWDKTSLEDYRLNHKKQLPHRGSSNTKIQMVHPHCWSKFAEQGFYLAVSSLGLKSKMMLSIQQGGKKKTCIQCSLIYKPSSARAAGLHSLSWYRLKRDHTRWWILLCSCWSTTITPTLLLGSVWTKWQNRGQFARCYPSPKHTPTC